MPCTLGVCPNIASCRAGWLQLPIRTGNQAARRFSMIARLLIFSFFTGFTGLVSAQSVVHYTTTTDTVKYLFATAEPVARLHSGDILDTNTLDSYGNAL